MADTKANSDLSRLIDGALEASVIGSFTRIGPVSRGKLSHWQPPEQCPGRVVVITGASSGLGREAAIELANLGCSIVAVGRDERRLSDLARQIAESGGTVAIEQADLANLDDAVALCDRISARFDHVDVLIHNAGALLNDYTPTQQGFETTLAVHLLAPYIMTNRLASPMARADQAKVIFMTSGGMYTERFVLKDLAMAPEQYRGSVAYARAKRAQVVLTQTWQRFEPAGQRTFCAVHPGWARTPGVAASLPTFQKIMGPLLRSPAEGVDTLVWLTTLPAGEPQGGLLWLDRAPRSPYKLRRTRANETTERLQGDELLAWLNETTAPYLTAL
jgi:NAD(P)-dependent dehydrogenase (short-subunit alcohol dehydrogenase family)